MFGKSVFFEIDGSFGMIIGRSTKEGNDNQDDPNHFRYHRKKLQRNREGFHLEILWIVKRMTLAVFNTLESGTSIGCRTRQQLSSAFTDVWVALVLTEPACLMDDLDRRRQWPF